MRNLSRALAATAIAALLMLLSAVPASGAGEGHPTSGPEVRPDATLALTISQAFPERRTSSYGAASLLAFLGGQLHVAGWSTETQPYTILTRAESRGDRSIVFVKTEGENLLALEDPGEKNLDFLLIAPYDNMFADSADSHRYSSGTAVSASTALEISRKLERDSSMSFGIAFVSGHYQYGAGLRALLQALEGGGIEARCFVIIGDLQPSRNVPIIASSEAPIAVMEPLMAKMRALGLDPFLATDWTLDFLSRAKGDSGRLSPESITGLDFSGEHDILAALGKPVITIGFPVSDATTRLRAAATPDETLEHKAYMVAEAVSSALSGPYDLSGPSAGSMQVVRFLGHTYLVSRSSFTISGIAVSLALAALALLRIPRDMASLALLGGTIAAATLSMFLHFVFTGRSAADYSSWLYPERAMALVFLLFAILTLMAFLRLWSIRSRIHHLHASVQSTLGPPPGKTTWGSNWGLAVLAALCLGASLSRSEVLPSLLIAGSAHAAGTLLLRLRSDSGRPRTPILWVSRVLYTVPLLAVFWAGSPLSPDLQAIYRGSWTGLNQGAMVSSLALAVVAASVLSTLDFPKPASPKVLLPLALCEFSLIGLLLISGFLLPVLPASGVPSWAVLEESFGPDTRLSFFSPSAITEVTMAEAPLGGPDHLAARAGLGNHRIADRREVTWATVDLTTTKASKALEGDRPVSHGSVSLRLVKQPDAVMIRIAEISTLRTALTGFGVEGLDSLLGPEAAGVIAERAVTAPRGYAVSFIWWRPTDLPPSLDFELVAESATRIGITAKVFYLDQSYLGLKPATPGVRYYQVTSVVAG